MSAWSFWPGPTIITEVYRNHSGGYVFYKKNKTKERRTRNVYFVQLFLIYFFKQEKKKVTPFHFRPNGLDQTLNSKNK